MVVVMLACCDGIKFIKSDEALLKFDEKGYCEYSFNVQPVSVDVIVLEQPKVPMNASQTQSKSSIHSFAHSTSKCASYPPQPELNTSLIGMRFKPRYNFVGIRITQMKKVMVMRHF